MEDHPVEGALFERAVMQCFHAIAMNASGEVTGSNWGSFPATRQIWMKDMYYAFLPFCILEPDLAGQIAGLIKKEQSCKEIVDEIMEQAEKLLHC